MKINKKKQIKIPKGWKQLHRNSIIKDGDKFDTIAGFALCCSTVGQTVSNSWGQYDRARSSSPKTIIIRKIK